MKLSKKIYYAASALLPLPLLKQIASPGTIFPYHHLISDKEVLHVKHLYSYKNIRQFGNDLDYLLKQFNPISVEELVNCINTGSPLPKNSFLLTFDDGFREVYDFVAPVLSAKGVPAIFFINPAFLDNRELFYRCKISLIIEEILKKGSDKNVLGECGKIMGDKFKSHEALISSVKCITNLGKGVLEELAPVFNLSFSEYLEKERPFLTSQQVFELRNKGFSIGAHSWDHPYYKLIPEKERIIQTVSSVEFVGKNFSQRLNLFSFPHSDSELDQSFFDQLKSTGVTDLLFGTQNQKNEFSNRVMHRFNAENPMIPLNKQVKGLLVLMSIRKFLRKDIVSRRN